MTMVRDTEETIAFVTGRGVLDPNTIPFDAWMVILESTVDLLSPKHLHGFHAVQDIVGMPIIGEVEYQYSSPPAKIHLNGDNQSWEFKWHFQYLVCGTRFSQTVRGGLDILFQEYLLFSNDSKFYILNTKWSLRQGKYVFSNNTKHGDLRVREADVQDVVEWCMNDKENGPYLLRGILENLFDAAEKTNKALKGKLRRAKAQQKILKRRLSSISAIKPGDMVWVIVHTHSNDRDFNNEFVPMLVQVVDVKDGLACFDRQHNRPLHSCFLTEDECRKKCPPPSRDP